MFLLSQRKSVMLPPHPRPLSPKGARGEVSRVDALSPKGARGELSRVAPSPPKGRGEKEVELLPAPRIRDKRGVRGMAALAPLGERVARSAG